ncbi:MAG: RnfABCDGE type electron transport complex subunit G [Fretibacterium sp.]|nr:RnfABCDGE type electron transport complex subunit G [Fretibacterium sp.]
MAKIVNLGLTLFVVTALTGLILGGVQHITAGAIENVQRQEKAEALKAVLPDADSFSERPLAAGADPMVLEVQEASGEGKNVGWCLIVSTKGYGGLIKTLVGLTSEGTVSAIRILEHGETPGLGAKAVLPSFSGQFDGKEQLPLRIVKQTPAAPDEIQAISGATITSEALVLGVHGAVEYWKTFLRGGVTP